METLDNVLVVDADGHVYEANVDLASRMPESGARKHPSDSKTTKATGEYFWKGVFDRYPKLKVGFMEGGVGWLPFWAERFDEHVEKLAPQMPELKRRPSDIIKSEQIVLTCDSEESGLDGVFAAAGENTMLYASDYRHWDCHFPCSVKDIVACKDFTYSQKERLLNRNAVDFFRLKNLPQPAALKMARRNWGQES